VVLELHIALTSCPGLFTVDHEAIWERRAPVLAGEMSRLGDADLVLHFALHTAFQHGFVAGEYHTRDFARALEVLRISPEEVLARAREWGGLKALGAMAVACRRQAFESPGLTSWLDRFEPLCPPGVRAYLQAQSHMPPPMSVIDLARVRYALAPSKRVFVWKSLIARSLPGRTAPRPGALRRLANLAKAGLPSPVVHRT
jgi:hypothetical protein